MRGERFIADKEGYLFPSYQSYLTPDIAWKALKDVEEYVGLSQAYLPTLAMEREKFLRRFLREENKNEGE